VETGLLPEAEMSLAADLCRKVCKHYGLSQESTKMAVKTAYISPGRAEKCYLAIWNSLQVEYVPRPLTSVV